MLSCAQFRDRLYDEDARRALEGGPVPHELAAHRDACGECTRTWAEALEDLRLFAEGLREPAPPALERRLRVGLAARYPPRAAVDFSAGIVWAAIGAVAAHWIAAVIPALAFLGPLSPLVGASIAFAANAVRDALREAWA
jgi:hypothetical protein